MHTGTCTCARCPSSSHRGEESGLEGGGVWTGQEEMDRCDNRRDEQDLASGSLKEDIIISERSPGEGNGNPLQCSCLENALDRGA